MLIKPLSWPKYLKSRDRANLLNHFQHHHIPLPFEETKGSERAQPVFPTPAASGEPLKVGGWKDKT
jgi:hypothetical protein